jgi:formylglycine-generating enzyme required for sulfatase activity
MLTVPGGSFVRGSDEFPDERPAEKIQLSTFRIDKFPVTNDQFAAFIDDGGYRRRELWTAAGWRFAQERELVEPTYWRDPVWNDPVTPVTGVSWWEALAFATWRGATLPTEAQWEYVCRGSAGNTYPWGDDPPTLELANFAPDGEPVERRPTRPDEHPRNVSEFGVVDLAGNFAEWCLDNYAIGYHVAGVDPVHVTSETDTHTVRGGCGLHDEDYLRCSARDHYGPGVRDNLIGFRCAAAAAGADENEED